MCGRFTLHTPADIIAERFELQERNFSHEANYNIAPTQQILTVTLKDQKYVGAKMRWGLIPPWQKQGQTGPPLINARLETLAEKPTFRRLVNNRRCLIIADGFFEWQQINSKKIPIYITLANGQPFAFAGLWDDAPEPSCTIITRSASQDLQAIHHRMPLILSSESEKTWLSSIPFDQAQQSLFDQESVTFNHYPVSTFVNSTKNNDPSCILPAQKHD